MATPQELTADNLILERTIESLDFKKPRSTKPTRRRDRSSHVLGVPEVINVAGLSQVLHKYVVYIDKRVEHHDQLCSIAYSMGATVSPGMEDNVNVVIFQPKISKQQKMPARYAKNNVKCVPPTWLFACYEENRHLPFQHFPFGVKKGQYTLGAVPVTEEDNPFGIEEVDYDEIEENKPGRQLTMDAFLTETMQQEEEEEDEQEEMEQEFYYNRRQETPEESQERKRAVNERMRCLLLDAEKAIKSKKNIARRAKKIDRKSVTPLDDDRAEMKIWYGEQSLPSVKRQRK